MLKQEEILSKKCTKKLQNYFRKKTPEIKDESTFKVSINEREYVLPTSGFMLDPEYFKNEIFIEIGRLKKYGDKMNKREEFDVSELKKLRALATDSLDDKVPIFDFARNILFTYAYYSSEEVDRALKIENKMIKIRE